MKISIGVSNLRQSPKIVEGLCKVKKGIFYYEVLKVKSNPEQWMMSVIINLIYTESNESKAIINLNLDEIAAYNGGFFSCKSKFKLKLKIKVSEEGFDFDEFSRISKDVINSSTSEKFEVSEIKDLLRPLLPYLGILITPA